MAICYSCNQLIYFEIKSLSISEKYVYDGLKSKFIIEKYWYITFERKY